MLQQDPDAPKLLDWANNSLAPPASAEDMAHEIIWIILCAGRKAQAARTIERRVLHALHTGRPVLDAYGHHGRANAIEHVWTNRKTLFEGLYQVIGDELSLSAWCRALPWVGQVTAFQLMKNFGVDCCKPDIWLCRLSGIPDRPAGDIDLRFTACMRLCNHLANETGDRVSAVDTLLWLACNKRVLRVDACAGPVTFHPNQITSAEIAPH